MNIFESTLCSSMAASTRFASPSELSDSALNRLDFWTQHQLRSKNDQKKECTHSLDRCSWDVKVIRLLSRLDGISEDVLFFGRLRCRCNGRSRSNDRLRRRGRGARSWHLRSKRIECRRRWRRLELHRLCGLLRDDKQRRLRRVGRLWFWRRPGFYCNRRRRDRLGLGWGSAKHRPRVHQGIEKRLFGHCSEIS